MTQLAIIYNQSIISFDFLFVQMSKFQPQLDVERIEDLVADRLAEILIMQLDYEKEKRQEKIKNENKYEKPKLSNN